MADALSIPHAARSVSAPGGGVERHDDSDADIDADLLPPPPLPTAIGDDSDTVPASAAPPVPLEEPQTPTEANTATAAAELLGAGSGVAVPMAIPMTAGAGTATGSSFGGGGGSGAGERRGSRPNLRLQSQAPPKLTSTATLAAPSPSSSLLPPASPMTPAGFGGVPPNTPLSSLALPSGTCPSPLLGGGGAALSGGEGCPSPLCDEPFTPLAVPMSPMLPQPPPPSPFPQPLSSPSRKVSDVSASLSPPDVSGGGGTLCLNFTTGRVASVVAKFNSPTSATSGSSTVTMAHVTSPAMSPHPVKQVMQLPSVMGGADALSPKAVAAVAGTQPPPLPLSPPIDQQQEQQKEEEQDADLPPQVPEPDAETEAELPPSPRVPAVVPPHQQSQDDDLPAPPQVPTPGQETEGDEESEHFQLPHHDSDSDEDDDEVELPPPPPPPTSAQQARETEAETQTEVVPESAPATSASTPSPPLPQAQQLPLPASPPSPTIAPLSPSAPAATVAAPAVSTSASASTSPTYPEAPYSPLPLPVPLVGLDAAHGSEEDESLDSMPSPRDGTNTLEVQVAHVIAPEAPIVKEAPLLLHRSRLGRLSIIQRDDLPNGVLLGSSSNSASPPVASASSSSSAASSSVASASSSSSSSSGSLARPHPSSAPPTAIDIARVPSDVVAKHSLRHGGAVVTSVKRVQHVTFNPNDEKGAAALASIPDEWREALKKQFGLPANLQASVALPAYRSRIPLVLVRMHEFLVANRALQTVGIFRLAPDSAECARLKAAINADVTAIERARSAGYADPSACMANLIKVWLRELPVALFHAIPGAELAALGPHTPPAELERLIATHLREPQQSIYRWLLDLCCDVTVHSDLNKMTAKNVAICIGPNLYSPPNVTGLGPQEAMKIIGQCKSYTNFLELCIAMREAQRGQPKTSSP